MESLIGNIKESYNELVHKVTWPTLPNLLSSTRVVLTGSVIIALIILLMDGISRNILEVIYNLGA
jgi:preprotein translocase subunit SecE